MMTALTTSMTSSSDASAVSALTQSVGRLNVGMPTATVASPGASTGAYQPALSSTTSVSVVMSNQIQPPSSNGASSISNSSAASPSWNSRPSTWMRDESAFERYTSMRQCPDSSRRSTTEFKVLHRRQ